MFDEWVHEITKMLFQTILHIWFFFSCFHVDSQSIGSSVEFQTSFSMAPASSHCYCNIARRSWSQVELDQMRPYSKRHAATPIAAYCLSDEIHPRFPNTQVLFGTQEFFRIIAFCMWADSSKIPAFQTTPQYFRDFCGDKLLNSH
jgi:hypothetical protein